MFVVKGLTLAGFVFVASLAPACADSSISALRDTEGLATGRFPAMSQVDCVEPYCFHRPNGSIDWERSTEALEKAQRYDKR